MLSKKTVGLSSTTIEPWHRVDGIGVYTQGLLDNLPKFDWDVSRMAWPNRKHPPTQKSPSQYFQHTYGSTALGQYCHLFSNIKISADIFHCTDYRVFRTSTPMVVTLHDAIPLKHPEWVNDNLRWIKNSILRKSCKLGDAYIALTNVMVEELVESFNINTENIFVIPNGIDYNWLQPVQPENIQKTLQKYSLHSEYFLFVGTFQPRKNIDRIIEAYLSLPKSVRVQHHLVLVGKNGWESEQTIQNIQRANADVQATIHWLQDIKTRDELRALYQSALALVFPSLHEGFGIPVLEAFASKIPVITSDASAFPEVAGDAALLINPYSTHELYAAMDEILHNSNLRKECIKRGFNRVQQFTWENTARLTSEVYKSVLA